MRDAVAVLGVGAPAGFNVAEAAHAAGYRVYGFDASPVMLPLADEVCFATLEGPEGVPDLIRNGSGDIPVICQPEALLTSTASLADAGVINWHGPRQQVILDSFNKSKMTDAFCAAGIGAKRPPVVIDVEVPDWLHVAKDRFGGRFWLRANEGAGATAAMLVEGDLRPAYHWIRLHDLKFGSRIAFIAEEYLPGRDYCWTALYHEGERVASFSRERMEWLYPRLAPFSGRTGTPTYARVVHDPRVTEVGEAAVGVLDREPHGVYCVDLREDEDGWPVPTEINAGRWATTSPAYHAFGPNLVAAQIRLAYGDAVPEIGDDCYPDGAEVLRHIDMGSAYLRPGA